MSNECCNPAFPSTQVPGPSGNNAWAVVTSAFTVPAASQNVTVSVNQTAGFVLGQNVYVALSTATGANFTVYSINSPTSITLTALGFSGDVAAGSTIAVNSLMVPGPGNIPVLSTVGFTTTTSSFNIASSVTISVVSSAPFIIGQDIFIGNRTQQLNAQITAIPTSTSITITPNQFPGDLLSGTIANGSIVTSGPGNDGMFGTATTLTAGFTSPGFASSSTIAVAKMNLSSEAPGGLPRYCIVASNLLGNNYATYKVTASSATSLTISPLVLPGDTYEGTFQPGDFVLIVGNIPQTGFAPGVLAQDPTNAGNQLATAAYATAPGSGFQITASSGPITINGIGLAITLPLAGTYVINTWMQINAVGATFADGSTPSNITFSLLNMPANNFSNNTVIRPLITSTTGPTTLLYGTIATFNMPPATAVVTVNTGVTIQAAAVIDTIPTAGKVEVLNGVMYAIKIA